MVEVVFLEEFLQRPERENLTQQLCAFGLGSKRLGLNPHHPPLTAGIRRMSALESNLLMNVFLPSVMFTAK